MRKLFTIISITTLISILVSCKNEITGDIIITNTNVIDIENLATIGNQTIAIENGSIKSITPFSKSDNYNSVIVVDGTDKFIIPSLWDMHVHYATSREHPNFRKLFIANGILGVRDLWGNLEVRDSLVASNSMMPRIFLSGEIMDGPFSLLQGSIKPKSADDAIRIVDSLHNEGADFIKVYDDLTKEIYITIANRCNELKFPFVGHTPNDMTALEASELGQKSIEHLNGIFESASSEQKKIDSLESAFKEFFLQRDIPNAIGAFTSIGKMYSSNYDENELIKLSNVLKENETYITPTLITHYHQWYRKDKSISSNESLKYIPKQMLESWNPQNEFPTQLFDEETWDSGKEKVTTAKKITERLNREDVKLLAGTDCGNFYIVPGFSLHDELELMVNSGMSTGQALKTATINPVTFFKMTDSLGTVAEKKIADLVLLNGNPLENIKETKNIYGVIKGGKYLDREKLDKLLKESETE
ncbi:amidohydrolase family protein [Mangrovimonas sp. ST2L15]|uniref:amidohydrolase family protein n=1 Tax=Mangrovimonas sp. ST2L15 TaxID=1645916 RepID=UPI0006B663F7|nr:amidohydrolase family protein [Mangrovimonas sp. ST2L15]